MIKAYHNEKALYYYLIKSRQSLRSIFRNTALSSLQGDSLAASFVLSCEKYPRKILVYFLSGINIK